MSQIKLFIVGITGRMGQEIVASANRGVYGSWNIIGGVGKVEERSIGDRPYLIFETIDQFEQAIGINKELVPDVVIDFSSPVLFKSTLEFCKKTNVPAFIGTTGLVEEDYEFAKSIAKNIPVLVASNTSVGVNTMVELVAEAKRALGSKFDVEIVELHHNKKKDSPSGTAVTLLNSIQNVESELGLDSKVLYGREGLIGERGENEIAVHAVRGGDVVGEHTVYFFGDGERIEITHRATKRQIFADGALRGASFIAKINTPKLYKMADALKL